MALGWFIAWSIAAGFAPNEISMDIFRAMQGIGMGAAIVSTRARRPDVQIQAVCWSADSFGFTTGTAICLGYSGYVFPTRTSKELGIRDIQCRCSTGWQCRSSVQWSVSLILNGKTVKMADRAQFALL